MQKRHRIFVAINVPQDIKKFLARREEKLADLPARWTNAENLHITLVFMGDLFDTEIGEACIAVKKVAESHSSFELSLSTIAYGPDNNYSFDEAQDKPPKMLWAVGEKSKELSLLKNNLQKSLYERVHFKNDNKSFSPHITLARIKTFAWRQIDPDSRPEVEELINLNFSVESVEVMESELKKGGQRYSVIESFQLTGGSEEGQ